MSDSPPLMTPSAGVEHRGERSVSKGKKWVSSTCAVSRPLTGTLTEEVGSDGEDKVEESDASEHESVSSEAVESREEGVEVEVAEINEESDAAFAASIGKAWALG